MREIKIITNEDIESVSVNDFFSFSVKYYNLSNTADTTKESDRIIVRWPTTGIWLIDNNKFFIEEDNKWKDMSEELSFFLEWQNPDSTHSPISLKMLFYAIVDSLKHDYWKTPLGEYQEHSIRISELTQHYSEKAIQKTQDLIQKQLNEIIFEDLKRNFTNHVKKKLRPTPEERMERGFKAMNRLDALRVPNSKSVPDPRQASINRREKDEKVSVSKTKSVNFTSPLVREQLVYKAWIELPHAVKSLILFNYEDRKSKFMPQYWDGTDYIQRNAILQHSGL